MLCSLAYRINTRIVNPSVCWFLLLLLLLNIAYTVMTSITHNIITATTASSTNSDTNNNGRNSYTNNNDNMNQQSNNNTIIHNSNHDSDVDGTTTTTAAATTTTNNNNNNTKIIIPCPTLCQVFVVSLIIGLISAITMIFVPPISFVMTIPLLWELGPSYVFFFIIGGIAQQNNWLHTIQLKYNRWMIYTWTILACAVQATIIAFGASIVDLFHGSDTAFVTIQTFVWIGPMGMSLCLAVTVFFMDYGNKQYNYSWFRMTDFFSKSMYTAVSCCCCCSIHY